MRCNYESSDLSPLQVCFLVIKIILKLQVAHLVTTHQFLDQILPQVLIEKLNNARQVAIEMKRRELSLLKEESFGMAHTKPEAGIHIKITQGLSGSLVVTML